MVKKSFFVCSECGYKSTKWLGKCPECRSWNSFIEEVISKEGKLDFFFPPEKKVSLESVSSVEKKTIERFFTGIDEFDRVCGGILKGQTILLSGDPGIGKSTLAIMIANSMSQFFDKVIYVNGEETNHQLKLKFERLGVSKENIFLFPEINVDEILNQISEEKNIFIIIDSIQTIFTPVFSALPGSLIQIRESTYRIIRWCKQNEVPVLLIGHITKGGEIAGPKVLEHIVDTLFFLDIDIKGNYRILKSLKNRFYRTEEIGLFAMEENGLVGVNEIEFDTFDVEGKSGVAFYIGLEGNRVIPTEIQSLCVPTQFDYPRRISEGLDINRFIMLIAILEKNLRIFLGKNDIYLNITNGLNISDTASDLAIILSIYSNYKDKPLPVNFAFLGEVGLSGELRYVKNLQKRINDCNRFGFKNIVIPYSQKEKIKVNEEIKIYPMRFIKQAIEFLFS
jgi:DNA repair protein RadA/Sms